MTKNEKKKENDEDPKDRADEEVEKRADEREDNHAGDVNAQHDKKGMHNHTPSDRFIQSMMTGRRKCAEIIDTFAPSRRYGFSPRSARPDGFRLSIGR